jgi:hypothetical protein
VAWIPGGLQASFCKIPEEGAHLKITPMIIVDRNKEER